MTEELKQNELKEEQLEDVAGGRWRESDNDYESGDTPKFKVGDIVWIMRGDYYIGTR